MYYITLYILLIRLLFKLTKHLLKMENITRFCWDMGELLVRKQKFGKLYDITSRTTEEISLFIDELIQAVFDIFKKCNIPVGVSEDGQTDKRISRLWIVAQCYKHLLWNTCFPSQKFLKPDFIYGINIWPNISPYLFIQVICVCVCILLVYYF